VKAATSTVPAEPSAARLGTPYRYAKRKEGKRDNAQVFRHRTLPVYFLTPSMIPRDRIVAPKNFPLRVLLVETASASATARCRYLPSHIRLLG
jgi:hypothetical protein